MAQWWNEWELRILVLASLGAQYFLVLFAGVRKFHIPQLLKFSFWMAHIGRDALAIFALATLFNRQKNGPGCSYACGGRESELLWAPIVLMHLGGQVVITTYKIEDNEQWSRHIITSLSKVTVALYVFYKSWSSSDKRLLAATILLFILVIIRCFQKARDLKSSSFNALRKASTSKAVRGTDVTKVERLEIFIEEVRKIMEHCGEPLETAALPSLPYHLFWDIPCLKSDRLRILKSFWSLDQVSALRAIENALSAMTSFLYTKDDSTPYFSFKTAPAALIFRRCTQVLANATLITAICLVHSSSHKEAYSGKDTGVTLVLLYGTLLLELLYLSVRSAFRYRFSVTLHQHSIIGLLVHNRKHPKFRTIAGWLQCKDLLDSFWRMRSVYSCRPFTILLYRYVSWGWKKYIRDPYSYSMYNDTRGEMTLARDRSLQQLGWSIRRPFDECIVLWHVATDFCRHHVSSSIDDEYRAFQCKEMSNYMVHLLSDKPEMFMPGSRKSLLATAYEQLEAILEGERTSRDEKELTQRVFEKCESTASLSQDTVSLVGDAWKLAQSLLNVDETNKWDLIEGVWVEMLCFSASRCRRYLHAEALGTRGEFLSYAWVLLAYAGMEIFPEKIQRRECNSFDSDESLAFGLARERGDAVTSLAAQSEGTVDIVLEA